MNHIFLFILFFCFILIGALIWNFLYKFIRSIKLRARFKSGRLGEVYAKNYLKSYGFKIIGEQVSLFSNMFIDGDTHQYQVKADFLVKKGNKTSIVEVKTGNKATDPLSTNTRRQPKMHYSYFPHNKYSTAIR